MYSLADVQRGIEIYKLKQILASGENDMFGNPINKESIEKRIKELEDEKV